MTDIYTSRRRPLVPSPGLSQTGGDSISQRAITLREQAREQQAQPGLVPLNPNVPQQGHLPKQAAPTGKIAKAIANVMKEVGTIKKRGVNEHFNYKYATFADLLYAITPLMGEHGLAITQSEIRVETVEGNRLSIQYEFVMYHESGECLPPQIHRGMCASRSRKGDFDDKAVAKCHTGAKKQFLLGQFNVPAGDFDDPDEDENATQRQAKAPVPGPKAAPTSGKAAEEGMPHKIALGQGAGADQWASAYIKAIEKAQSEAEVKEWDKANDETLQLISDRYSKVYDIIDAAVQQRFQDLGVKIGMPDPKVDAQQAMNWIATELQKKRTLVEAVAFWNEQVEPHKESFDESDWSMLEEEWRRTRERITGEKSSDAG